MRTFFKIFFASLLALIIFSVIAFFIGAWAITKATQPEKPEIGSNGILVLDLSTAFKEQAQNMTVASLAGYANNDVPGLYDVIQMLRYAKRDAYIKGLYIKANDNANGFAASEELRNAIIDFKQSKKFVIAYGEAIDQKSYYVANVADKIYCHPLGGIEWKGFGVTYMFMKNLLDRLEIEPQIFYAGKFKSATEPFRATEMTEPNRIQTTEWLNDLYTNLLTTTAQTRNIDTAKLLSLAMNGTIRTANDAVQNGLVDGLMYDNDIKAEFFKRTGQKEKEKLNYVTLSTYAKAVDFSRSGNDKIAVIYAEGEIVSGKGDNDQIGSDEYKVLLRKARMDSSIKAIVFRVNSPGGSALASDVIWNEVTLAKKTKPVVVSMGDYAASGGYYISCAGDSIFAEPSTITGSIGVFSILPNLQSFFKDKLGITFDGVKTAPYADLGAATRPLTEVEKRFLQNDIDTIYNNFKQRVAQGRNRDVNYIDSIAQGRVWTGERAVKIGLVDRIGTLDDAIRCAARMAKTNDYRTREYPEKKSWLEQLIGGSTEKYIKDAKITEEIGADQYNMLKQIKKVQTWFGIPQTRLPFDFTIN